MIASFVASIPVGVIIGLFGRAPFVQAAVRTLFVIAVDAAAGLFVIYSNIIDEDFGDFRVCILPLESSSPVVVVPTQDPART